MYAAFFVYLRVSSTASPIAKLTTGPTKSHVTPKSQPPMDYQETSQPKPNNGLTKELTASLVNAMTTTTTSYNANSTSSMEGSTTKCPQTNPLSHQVECGEASKPSGVVAYTRAFRYYYDTRINDAIMI